MNQYLGSISPPTDPELCDARLVAMSLALDNLVLVTSSILTGCQWLQVCQSIENTPYYFDVLFLFQSVTFFRSRFQILLKFNLQDSLRDIDEKITDLREYLNQETEDVELTKV